MPNFAEIKARITSYLKPYSKWIPKRPSWSKATFEQKEEYRAYLETQLLNVETKFGQSIDAQASLLCSNPKCKNESHSKYRDSYVLDILSSVIESSHVIFPRYGGCWVGEKRPGICIPGWNTEVRPYKDQSLYWGCIWKQAGRPNTGWVHDNYIQARNQYHRAVLKVKRRRKQYQAGELLVASMQGDVELLKQMKQIKGGKNAFNSQLPDIVGSAIGEHNIAEMFRESYEQLYNSAPSVKEMSIMKEDLDNLILAAPINEVEKVTESIVKQAVIKLKSQKTDISGSFVSDALKTAPDLLYAQLPAVFRSWLYHGTVTKQLLACSFLPLLKSSLKDPADPASYRAIAGSSLILKIFELVVLLLWGNLLSSDSLQFGYKSKTSTTHCTWLVSEVTQQKPRGAINPIITVINCGKAFN